VLNNVILFRRHVFVFFSGCFLSVLRLFLRFFIGGYLKNHEGQG
jgi:hypothetical protein